jgi:hypothetical protein
LNGSTEDLRSLIFRRRNSAGKSIPIPYKDIVTGFDARYAPVLAGLPEQYAKVFDTFEGSQREKIGNKSAFDSFFVDGPRKVHAVYSDKPRRTAVNEGWYKGAIDRLASTLQSRSIRVSSKEEAIKGEQGDNRFTYDSSGMDLTTSSGPTWFIGPWYPTSGIDPKKRPEVQACYDYISGRYDDFIAAVRAEQWEVWFWTGMTYHRLVSRGSDVHDPKRNRLIIALEKAEPILWKIFTVALQESLRATKSPGGVRIHVAWMDLPNIDVDMQIMLREAEAHGRAVVSGDLSNFDATIPPWMLRDLGPVIDNWLQTDLKLGEALCYCLAYRTQLITPVGLVGCQPSSMKSGSGGTNLLDSLCNVLVHYYAEEAGLYKVHNLAVQGDDFVIDGEGVEPGAVEEAFEVFGMEANKSKQMYERGVLSYLQHIHFLEKIGGIASVYRSLSSSLTYERLRFKSGEWNPFAEIVRTISQLEVTALSPFFETLVEFVQEGDRYKLGANYPASEIISRSGQAGVETLERGTASVSKSGLRESGFDRLAVNRVLRGWSPPPWGSRERFLEVYGERASGITIA